MTPFEIAALLGAVSGWALVTYLIYKSRMDKAKLEFEDESKYFYPSEGNNQFSTVVIRIKAHNKGTKSTTIYNTKLSFTYDSNQHKIKSETTVDVLPNSTVDFSPVMHIHMNDFVIYDKITDCVLTAKHTFGTKVHNLGTIEQLKN